MAIYDVTVPLSNEMPTYPGDPGIQISAWRSLSKGDSANVSLLHLGAHTGTHVDAPSHFIDGAPGMDSISLEACVGEAHVIEVPPDRTSIDEVFVSDHCPAGVERVLFKTRNSAFWNDPKAFREDFTYLETAAAEHLVKQRIKLVGIDYLSIEKFHNPGHPTHLALLSNSVVIVEGLNLAGVPAGRYELICLPLRIESGNGDGSPARVVLRTI